MNGALYISFFQGQLESALEQVVQLAVQEITKSVGASLCSMLLETASKEQENQRLRARLQGGDGKAKGAEEPGGTKDEQRGSCLGFQADSLRLEQKRRASGGFDVISLSPCLSNESESAPSSFGSTLQILPVCVGRLVVPAASGWLGP
ncbi:hypothetical protein NFI96_003326 [Prochilodus magdalenae]|nr:hypothetical protein NFI96_003326 [Prochilodus magdalenae]